MSAGMEASQMAMLENMDAAIGQMGGGKGGGAKGPKKPDREEEAMMSDIMSNDISSDKSPAHKDEDILAGADSEMPADVTQHPQKAAPAEKQATNPKPKAENKKLEKKKSKK